MSDVSLLYATMEYKDRLILGVLENIVFLGLKRRGYKVYIEKLDTIEVDFNCQKSGHKMLYLSGLQARKPRNR